jgi:hypothetical protein
MAVILTMRHRELRGCWLPDNRLGSAAANILCAMRLHTPFCRGTVRCSRRRFGI